MDLFSQSVTCFALISRTRLGLNCVKYACELDHFPSQSIEILIACLRMSIVDSSPRADEGRLTLT